MDNNLSEGEKMKQLTLILVCLHLTGCGISKSLDSLPEMEKSVGGMTARLDKIGKGIDSMNEDVKGLNGSLKGMSAGIDSVKGGIHSQSLLLMLGELSKPSKYVSLTSVNPIDFIAAGKSLAELASPDDLAGIFFLWITEINSGSNDGLTKAQKNEMDLVKWNKLTALQTVAGFLPQKTLDELIKINIEKSGQYEEITYNIICLRHLFISTFLLEQGVMSGKMAAPTQYEQAFLLIDQLQTIQKYPFVGNIGLKLIGFYDTGKIGLNQNVKLDVKNLKKYYSQLKKKFDTELNVKYTGERVTKIKHMIEQGLN